MIGRRSVALAGLAAAGCSPLGLLDTLTPRAEVGRALAQPYAAGPRGRMDLYWPPAPPRGAPILVFFYGGSWTAGAREDYRFAGEAFASRGYITAVPDYRIYPEGRWPVFLEDAAAAVAAVRAAVAAQGLPSDGPLILAGHSAGAHIAMMLALDARWLGAAGMPPRAVAAVLGIAGPYDFLPLTGPAVQAVFAEAETLAATQPIRFASSASPPAVLLTGAEDDTVRPGNSERLAAALRGAGVPVALKIYPGIGHIRIVTALAATFRNIAPVLEDADTLLRAMLRASGAERGGGPL